MKMRKAFAFCLLMAILLIVICGIAQAQSQVTSGCVLPDPQSFFEGQLEYHKLPEPSKKYGGTECQFKASSECTEPLFEYLECILDNYPYEVEDERISNAFKDSPMKQYCLRYTGAENAGETNNNSFKIKTNVFLNYEVSKDHITFQIRFGDGISLVDDGFRCQGTGLIDISEHDYLPTPNPDDPDPFPDPKPTEKHPCAFCNATGEVDCKNCDGKGYIEIRVDPFGINNTEVVRKWCDSPGCRNGKKDCPVCNGSKYH